MKRTTRRPKPKKTSYLLTLLTLLWLSTGCRESRPPSPATPAPSSSQQSILTPGATFDTFSGRPFLRTGWRLDPFPEGGSVKMLESEAALVFYLLEPTPLKVVLELRGVQPSKAWFRVNDGQPTEFLAQTKMQKHTLVVSDSMSTKSGKNTLWLKSEQPLELASFKVVPTAPPAAVSVAEDEPGAEPAPASDDIRRARRNVVLFLVDTMRPDFLGCYGQDPSPSPTIDRLAETALVFENAYAPSSWTKPSVASLFTGQSPAEHQVADFGDVLDSSFTTLAEQFQQAGYETAGFVTNGWLSQEFGFHQGFETYVFEDQRPAQLMVDEFNSWLRQRSSAKPFFAYVHTIEPHAPYELPGVGTLDLPYKEPELEPSPQLLERLHRHYKGEIESVDRALDSLLQTLEAEGLSQQTLVVVVSDHGEEFFEHGWWEHGATLYEEVLRIPLLIALPGLEKQRLQHPVSLQELGPTLLWLNQVEAVPKLLDPSPRRLHAHLKLGEDADAYPETVNSEPFLMQVDSVRENDLKLIRTRAHLSPTYLPFELYHLDRDPAEHNDLCGHSKQFSRMVQRLKLAPNGARTKAPPEVVQERVRSLQYLP